MPQELAALLLADGAVSPEILDRALARQREAGGALDTALLELGAIEEARLLAYLGRASELPVLPDGAFADTDPRARRLFPPRVAERHGLAPFAVEGRELKVVAAYPVDLGLFDEVSFMLSLQLAAHVGLEVRVRELVQRLYGAPLPPRLAELARKLRSGEISKALSAPETEEPDPEPRGELTSTPDPALPGDAGSDFFSPGEEALVLPDFFEEVSQDPLEAALTQAVESAELDFFVDEDLFLSAPGAEEEPAPKEPEPERPPESSEEKRKRREPPHWSLTQAQAALEEASHRDGAVLVALRYARDFFEFAALFAVTRDALVGHDALGREDGMKDLVRSVALYASDPGVFRMVLETGGQYLGPVTRETGTEAVLRGLGRGSPHTVLVFPIRVRGRVTGLVYADNGDAPVSARRVGDFILFLSTVGNAFERILFERKKRTRSQVEEPWRAREPGRSSLPENADEASAEEAREEEGTKEGDPADLGKATRDDAPSVGESALSLGEGAGQESEPAPGAGPAVGGMESVSIDEETGTMGTEGSALSPPSVPATEGEPAVPPASLVTLAELAVGEDESLAAGARRALASRRGEPGMQKATDRLNRALLSGITERSVPAALALGELREVEAIPLLMQLLEDIDPNSAQAAAHALRTITGQPLGIDARRWLAWWKENRGRGRAEWLLSALNHPDRDTRAAAAAELGSVAPPPVAYSADMAPKDREQAAQDWAAWWKTSGATI